MVRYAPVAFLLVTAYQCHGDAKKSAASTDAGTTPAGATASAGTPAPPPPDDIFHKDPCRYVSQAETEAYLGPLLHAPYRGTDDLITPDSNGRFCVYRAKDGRSIDVSANWIDGQSQIKKLTEGFLNSLFVNDKGKTDTLSDVWDQATIRDGSLFALKGDTLFEIGYGASKAGLVGATKLAEDAIGRLGKPLAYNGAAATGGVPGPLVKPRDPCTLVTRAEFEAIMGPLTADPTSDGTSCTYPAASGTVVLRVGWTNGYRQLFSQRGAALNAHAMTNQQFFNLDSGIKDLRAGMAKKAAPGTTLPSANDTVVSGPWDDSRQSGLEGTTAVVKLDVIMELPLIRKPGAAVALLTTAMNKIP
jgi:hypothetical protein